jgi:cation diffusion facilitator family transporter
MADQLIVAAGGRGQAHARSRAAAVSVASNTGLIALKVLAGVLTGSVAVLTQAPHSSIDLLASLIAFFSVRRAEAPADEGHRYGHDKFENAAAAAEGMLILVGSGVIVFAAIRSLARGPHLEKLGFGIVVVAFAAAVNLGSRPGCSAAGARRPRPRSRATQRTCAPTPTRRSACSPASRSSRSPAPTGWTRWSR